MKSPYSFLVLCVAIALTGTAAYADKPSAKPALAKAAPCGCEVKSDGKVCGVDTKCCCTGEKAKGRETEKKAAKDECADGKCEDTAKSATGSSGSGK